MSSVASFNDLARPERSLVLKLVHPHLSYLIPQITYRAASNYSVARPEGPLVRLIHPFTFILFPRSYPTGQANFIIRPESVNFVQDPNLRVYPSQIQELKQTSAVTFQAVPHF
jgi:hypothetical protein